MTPDHSWQKKSRAPAHASKEVAENFPVVDGAPVEPPLVVGRLEFSPVLERSIPRYIEDMGDRHAVADVSVVERDGARPGDNVAAGATKKDYGKHPVFTLCLDYFPLALSAVANVSEYGARKYHKKGWMGVPDGYNRYSDADVRHLIREAVEGPYDDGDSGLAHAAQHAWNALARLELALREGTIEDRRGNDILGGKPVLGTARKV